MTSWRQLLGSSCTALSPEEEEEEEEEEAEEEADECRRLSMRHLVVSEAPAAAGPRRTSRGLVYPALVCV